MAFSFGSNTPKPGSAAGATPFGTNSNQQQTKPLFGGASTPTGNGGGSSLFGGGGSTTPAAPAGGNLFGNAAASGGQQNTTFGSGTSTPGGMFGAKPAATNGGEQKNVFGGGTTTPQQTPGGIFGNAAPAAGGEQKTGGSLFGGATPAPSGTSTPLGGGFSFGQKKEEPKQTPAAGASLFGGASGTPANTQQSTTPNTNPPAGGGMFGGNTFNQNKPQAAPPSSGGSLFGGAQAPAAGQESKASAPLSFGSAANTAAPAAGAAAGGGLFAGLGSKPSSGTSTPRQTRLRHRRASHPLEILPLQTCLEVVQQVRSQLRVSSAASAANRPKPTRTKHQPQAQETRSPNQARNSAGLATWAEALVARPLRLSLVRRRPRPEKTPSQPLRSQQRLPNPVCLAVPLARNPRRLPLVQQLAAPQISSEVSALHPHLLPNPPRPPLLRALPQEPACSEVVQPVLPSPPKQHHRLRLLTQAEHPFSASLQPRSPPPNRPNSLHKLLSRHPVSLASLLTRSLRPGPRPSPLTSLDLPNSRIRSVPGTGN